jgi:hypothetical protein
MRWLILGFILALTGFGNYALLEQLTVLRALGSVAFNCFGAALAGAWWSAYFTEGPRRSRGLIVSHALLMLAAGLGLAVLGATVVTEGSCRVLVSSSQLPGLLSRLGTQADAIGLCHPVGFAFIALGFFVAYPSVRLFFALGRPEETR